MNGKIVYLEYESPRCKCGRDLPKDRKRRCYICQPPRGFHCAAASGNTQAADYTLADREAQAYAYGLSYGQFMAHIDYGSPLPKRRRAIRWPLGSAHRGEEDCRCRNCQNRDTTQ